MSQSPTTEVPPLPLSIHQRVEQVINRIRPAVQSDGGDVELVEVTKEGIARIRLHGACVGCPSSSMTLHMGIERGIREKVPEVVGVEQVH
jgi:Fe-S cluster biogenesis protein NfuA